METRKRIKRRSLRDEKPSQQAWLSFSWIPSSASLPGLPGCAFRGNREKLSLLLSLFNSLLEILSCFYQVALGIATLLTYVPVSLGSAHQAGALTLFSVALALMHSLRPAVRRAPGPLSAFVTPAVAALVMGVGYSVTQLT